MKHDLALSSPGADQVLARLPREILDSLTPEQIAAIRKAIDERAWGSDHYINIRHTIPLPSRPIYLAMVAGRERRNRVRRESVRLQHPLRTVGNFIFAAAASGLLVAAAVMGFVLGAILDL